MNDKELAEEIERKLGNMAEDFRWAITFSSSKWQQIIAALRRGHEPKRAMIDDVPLCAGHADWWFTSRNHLKGDTSCVVCAFNPERPPSGEMVTERMVEVAAKWISESPLIQEPKLPPPAWMGLARHILQAAAEAEVRKADKITSTPPEQLPSPISPPSTPTAPRRAGRSHPL